MAKKSKKKTKSKRKVKAKAKQPAPAEPSPEAIARAKAEMAMRGMIAAYLLLPPAQILQVAQVANAEGQAVPNVAQVTLQVNLGAVQAYVARRAEEKRRRDAAVGQ